MLQLKDISKSFGDTQVLHPTNLTAASGETTVLIGPSGCGKSTMLRIMIGLIRSDSGTVTFDGIQLNPDNVLELRHRMGYVLQDGGLFPHLTARDNVTLMARYLGRGSAAEQRDRIEELAQLTQLPLEALDRFPRQISGGQRQRVAIMRALMLDPQMLLLDEPLGALDPMIRVDLQNDLKRIFQKLHKTVVMVTHDMSEAGFFGDKIVLLNEGRVQQSGAFRELVESPADEFVERFISAQRGHIAAGPN